VSATVEHWPVCQKCLTACVKYLPPNGGGVTAWKQDCHCRRTFFATTGSEGFMVYPATASWGVVLILCGLMILVAVGMLIAIMAYANLESQVQDACSETGAAAKLDLSSFVPVCLRVK
jgi:hypothetical protein